jgi:hypothetical protein
VVQSFCEFILGLPEADSADRAAGLNQFSKSLSCRVVSFLLEVRDTVLFAPADLKEEVEQHLGRFQEKEVCVGFQSKIITITFEHKVW